MILAPRWNPLHIPSGDAGVELVGSVCTPHPLAVPLLVLEPWGPGKGVVDVSTEGADILWLHLSLGNAALQVPMRVEVMVESSYRMGSWSDFF